VGLFRRKPKRTYSEDWLDEWASPYQALLAAGRFAELEDALMSTQREDREGLLRGSLVGVHDPTDWARSEGSYLSLLALGSHFLAQAWEDRGAGRATEVSDSVWQRTEVLSEQALDVFQDAHLRNPQDPTALSFMMGAAPFGLVSRQDLKALHDRAVELDPTNFRARANYVFHMAQKWGGSHQGAHDYVRSLQRDLPAGSTARGLLAEAHVENWFYHVAFERDDRAAETYFRNEVVRAEVRQAAYSSVLHPSHVRTSRSPSVMTWLLFCAWKCDDGNLVRDLLVAIGDEFIEHPWPYAIMDGKTGQLMDELRAFCGLKN
jgi:hypothetical protein